jgi:hypothetical protein
VLAAFWEAAGGRLADRWATVSIPALIFWLGGLAAYTYHRGGLHTLANQTWLKGQSSAVQVTLILIALLAIAASGIVVERAAAPVLRLLGGYWPSWTLPLRRWLTYRLTRRAADDKSAWQQVYARIQDRTATTDERAALARLERRLRRRPAHTGDFLPTPIGNILRAAERRPADKYGLDAVAVWPHLWLLLPEATRAELRRCRASLDTAVVTATWGILFCTFAPFTWLAIPIGLAVTVIAVIVVIPARAQVFGDMIEAAYDLHRTALYQQLRWPLPANPRQEHSAGVQLTSYLYRGSDSPTPTFSSVGNGPQPIAELRGTVERAVFDSLDAARSEPVLANWSGQVGARIETSDGRHADRLMAGLDYQLLVTFSRHLSEDFECRSIDVRGGRDIDPVAFELLLDSDTAVFPPTGRELLVPADGSETSVKYSFKAPQQAGELRLWIQVLQLNRLLQAVTVTASVDKPEESVK